MSHQQPVLYGFATMLMLSAALGLGTREGCRSGDNSDAGSADSGSATCGSGSCGSGEVCVKNQIVGGAFIPPDDAGTCPPPRIIVPEAPLSCSMPPTFHCAPLAAACLAAPSCNCAGALCGTTPCKSASTTLVECLLLAP